MQFQKVTASKYIGQYGYSLQKCGNTFSIYKDNQVTRWGTGFQTISSASHFLSTHSYIHASQDNISPNEDDVRFIYDAYCIKGDPKLGSRWYVTDDFYVRAVRNANDEFSIKTSDGDLYNDTAELTLKLDEIANNDIFASVTYRGIEFRQILAAKGRSSRDFTKNLIRVKSSNVWSYGIEINENDAKVGDVYIQFKGKNGGPADVYKYYDVPLTLWRKFVSYPSKGAFVHKYLRNNFLYSKLTGDKKGKLKNAVNN